jgi:hypothetical protein
MSQLMSWSLASGQPDKISGEGNLPFWQDKWQDTESRGAAFGYPAKMAEYLAGF